MPLTHEGQFLTPESKEMYNEHNAVMIITDKIHCVAVNGYLLVLINTTHGQSWAWDKEKIWVPDRIRTHGLSDTGQALYSLSYGELTESEAIIVKVHIWHTSCILLGSAMLRSYCLVKEWKIVKFTIFHFFTNHYMVF